MLVLPEHVRRDLARECAAAAPREACGFLLGLEGDGTRHARRVAPVRNVEREDAVRRFRVHPDEFLEVAAAAEAERLEILAVYHSHVDAAGTPSDADCAEADPGWSHVIVGLRTVVGDVRVVGIRSWVVAAGATPRLVEEAVLGDRPPASKPGDSRR